MQYSDMKKSIEILEKYSLDEEWIEADYDVIYGPSLDAPFSDEDKQRLEELGWFESSEFDCWSHFC